MKACVLCLDGYPSSSNIQMYIPDGMGVGDVDWVCLEHARKIEKYVITSLNTCTKCGGEKDSEGWCAYYCTAD